MKKGILFKISNIIIVLGTFFFAIFMSVNVILSLTKTAIFPRDYQETLYYKNDNTILNIISLMMFSIVILMLTRYLKKIISSRKLVLVAMIYMFIASLIFAILRRDYVQFDPFNVIDQASNFIRGNYSGLEKGNNYLYIYAHQITTVFVFQIILFLFGQATFILYLMQCFSISFIVFYLYKIANELFNDEDINYMVIILCVICFPLIFYVAFVYGTLPGMFLVLLSWYNFIVYTREKKWYRLVVIALSFNLSILLIGNNIIHLLALFIVAGIYFLKNKDVKIISFVLSTVLIMIASKSLIFNYYEIKSGKEIPNGVNKITWIAMGMQEGEREAGWWNNFNYDIMTEENYSEEKVKEISINSIKERLAVFKNNKSYAADFYKRKYENQFIDPTFQSLLVTAPVKDFEDSNTLEKIKNNIVYQVYLGFTNKILIFSMKVFQIFIYLFSLVYAYIAFKKKNELYLIIPIAFLGGTIFHMIWEAKSRYIFPYFVYLIPLAAYGFIFIKNKLIKFKKRKEQ